MRQGNIQGILINMVHDLTMKQVQEFVSADPTLDRSKICSKLIQQAYDRAHADTISEIMGLTYDETEYLELQLHMFALKGLRYFEEFQSFMNRDAS